MPIRKKVHVIRQARQVGALISPFRHHLMRTLSSIGPATVRELAEALGRSPESLYYHLRALERVGLIEDRSETGDERAYDTRARLMVTDPSATAPAYLQAYKKSAAALLRLAERFFARAVDAQAAAKSRRPKTLRIQQLQVRLDAQAKRELARRLDELVEFLAEADRGHGSEAIAVTLVSSPTSGAEDER